jgi:DegV family protein with EDD domain
MGVIYYTDSGCDLPLSYIKERNLHIIPLIYKIGDREITEFDDPSMPSDVFYARMRGGEMSSTAQVNTYTFIELFRADLERGDDVFYVALSSGLSGTYQSAVLARAQLLEEFPDRKIYILDSLQASAGQGLIMHYALNMRDEGKDTAKAFAWLEENRLNFCAWFTVSDLEFLRRGGRVSAAAAFLGTMLNIKPVLRVDDEGHLIPIEKVKGRARALRGLVDHMEKTAILPDKQTVFISHGDSEADAKIVADMVRERFGTQEILLANIGPVIGAHAGPDTIALFFYGKQRG